MGLVRKISSQVSWKPPGIRRNNAEICNLIINIFLSIVIVLRMVATIVIVTDVCCTTIMNLITALVITIVRLLPFILNIDILFLVNRSQHYENDHH